MTIGSYGSVSFTVSSSKLHTFDNMKHTAKANYTQHKVHGKQAVPEFTGWDSEKITFDMLFSAFLGTNPLSEMEKLKKILQSKKAYTLALGTDTFGKWLLTDMSSAFQHVYKDGKLMQIKVSVTLLRQE